MKGKKIVIFCLLTLIMITSYVYYDLIHIDKTNHFDQEVVSPNDNITYDELVSYTLSFQCGDIINIENTNYLSSYAIPGRWKHTLIYLGTKQQVIDHYDQNQKYYEMIMEKYEEGNEILVIDANNTGVKIRYLNQMANLKADSYLKALTVYRFEKDQDFINTYINKALDYQGTPYDFQMKTFDDSALYCSELLYYALLDVDIQIKKTSTIFDHQIITPTDLIDDLKSLPEVKHIILIEKKNGQIIQSNE